MYWQNDICKSSKRRFLFLISMAPRHSSASKWLPSAISLGSSHCVTLGCKQPPSILWHHQTSINLFTVGWNWHWPSKYNGLPGPLYGALISKGVRVALKYRTMPKNGMDIHVVICDLVRIYSRTRYFDHRTRSLNFPISLQFDSKYKWHVLFRKLSEIHLNCHWNSMAVQPNLEYSHGLLSMTSVINWHPECVFSVKLL